jgi:signal transduction histidine kinase
MDDHDMPWHAVAEEYRKDDEEVLADARPRMNYEEHFVDWEGNEKHIKTSKIPLRDNYGEVIGTLGCWVDITSEKEHERKIEEHARRLERTNQELDNFVYRVSHDLKSPISSVKGLVNIARLETDPVRQRECLDMIEHSMNKLDEFILEILDYSRNARFELTVETIDLKKLILDIFEQHKYIESPHKPRIDINIEGKGEIRSDKRRLSYIFNNLISNALKFTDPENGPASILVDVWREDGRIIVLFSDKGIGIEEAHIHSIFDMFYRATEGRPGSGLGLYIVKEALAKLKGTITVQSEPGQGTVFTISIPELS